MSDGIEYSEAIRTLVYEKGLALGDLNAAKLMAIEAVKMVTPAAEGAVLPNGVFRCGLCGTEHGDGPVSGVGSMYWCETCRRYRFVDAVSAAAGTGELSAHRSASGSAASQAGGEE